ncbi:hypothetical protein [Ralstonia pseudosolanacearum]
MSSFDALFDRMSKVSWSGANPGYIPSSEEMDRVVQFLKFVAEIARRRGGATGQHILVSPARLLGYVPTEHVIKAIDGQVSEIADAYAKAFVRNAMEWSAMAEEGQLPEEFPSDLFEPILLLIERGCQIRLSKGFLEIGDKVIPVHRWPDSSVA